MECKISKEELKAALAQKHGKENQEKFEKATVAICGLGGLGSNVAIALARAGVGNLILIDFDKVEISNLNRQQYKICQLGMEKAKALQENLAEIAPFTKTQIHVERVTEENAVTLLSEADVICEAFDRPEAKAMLVNTVLEKLSDKYLVSASGMAGFSTANTIKTRRIGSKLFFCGDEESDVDSGIGLVSSRVLVCAAHEAHAVIRIITGEEK